MQRIAQEAAAEPLPWLGGISSQNNRDERRYHRVRRWRGCRLRRRRRLRFFGRWRRRSAATWQLRVPINGLRQKYPPFKTPASQGRPLYLARVPRNRHIDRLTICRSGDAFETDMVCRDRTVVDT